MTKEELLEFAERQLQLYYTLDEDYEVFTEVLASNETPMEWLLEEAKTLALYIIEVLKKEGN